MPEHRLYMHPAISADGSHVAFMSDANNFVPSDTNGQRDFFLSTIPSANTAPTIDTNGGGSTATVLVSLVRKEDWQVWTGTDSNRNA